LTRILRASISILKVKNNTFLFYFVALYLKQAPWLAFFNLNLKGSCNMAKFKIKSLDDLISKLNSGRIRGLIIWQGASIVDGAQIALVCNRFASNGQNEKTGGDMVQSWILPDPAAAGIIVQGSRPAQIMAYLKATGAKSICGDCKHAWQFNPITGEHEKGSCYVMESRAPAAVLGSMARGSYPIAGIDFPAAWISEIFKGRKFRGGAYGDPAAIPASVWANILRKTAMHTGYTHFWKSLNPAARANAEKLMPVFMASCDSTVDLYMARFLGWRGFMVAPQSKGLPDLAPFGGPAVAMHCPASKQFEKAHGRKTNCQSCGACAGITGPKGGQRAVVIPAHGYAVKNLRPNVAAA
jgi:hypothetical protein